MSDQHFAASTPQLPSWAQELATLYESGAANQFVLYGNINDRMMLRGLAKPQLGSLSQFLLDVLMPRFDVVLTYDLGNGLRVERGQQTFATWPAYKDSPALPKAARASVETLTHYFRYCANLVRVNQQRLQIGCIISAAHLVAPAAIANNPDIAAIALLLRDWALDPTLADHPLATFLVAENINDLHPLLANNGASARVRVPLPTVDDLSGAISFMAPKYPKALANFNNDTQGLAAQLVGATLGSVESMLKTREHDEEPLKDTDLVALKKKLIENDSNGLIEFIESKKTLDDLYGQQKIKEWIRQDIALWKQNDLQAMPMGYLLCGPVGTGKTFMVECIAGEAGVPVVKLKNFRDKWVGSTEGNLERIFRLIHALGRCYVFVDEADQALGKRDSGADDGGLSGRVYSMVAEEMSRTANRGKIVWVLASSRPDLIEVDLKRPGRVDVKIPIFPTTSGDEAFNLVRALCKRRGLDIPESAATEIASLMPDLLTAGAAEALAVKVYRLTRVQNLSPIDALKAGLKDYQNPIPRETMEFQIGLALRESTDAEFVPARFRPATKTV